jgi:hypothetical protein
LSRFHAAFAYIKMPGKAGAGDRVQNKIIFDPGGRKSLMQAGDLSGPQADITVTWIGEGSGEAAEVCLLWRATELALLTQWIDRLCGLSIRFDDQS